MKRTAAKQSKEKCTKVGRKAIQLKQKQWDQIEALATCMNLEQIAKFLGISSETFRKIRRANPKTDLIYNEKRVKDAVDISKNLTNMAKKDTPLGFKAAKFYASTRMGWTETTRVETTGKNGGPIKTDNKTSHGIDVKALSDEGLDALSVVLREVATKKAKK